MTSHEILSKLADEYIKAIQKKAEIRYSDFEEELRTQHQYAYMAGYFEQTIRNLIVNSDAESTASRIRRELEVIKNES